MRNFKSSFIVSVMWLISLNSVAQLEFSKWYFGNWAGLDFQTNPPSALFNNFTGSPEACASIADNSGNLLFYSYASIIVNSQHVTMANGNAIDGSASATQGALIVKQPGNSNLYYVFALAELGSQIGGQSYSVVDMNLAAGLGSVTVKNATLYLKTCEKQVAVRHCNGKDVWILSHEYQSNNFRAYLLTAAGVNTVPVISSVGETPIGNVFTTWGQMKVSMDGKKIAMAISENSSPITMGTSGFSLFDFDAATGVVSNHVKLNQAMHPYGVEFSPDGTKLYGTISSKLTTSISNVFYQWDVCATNSAAIVNSQYSVAIPNTTVRFGSAQLAIDGKIYLAQVDAGLSGNGESPYLSVINNPNASGAAMAFSLNAVDLSPKKCKAGLPNYINSYTKPIPAQFGHTVNCQSVNFVLPPLPTFSSGCTSTPYAPKGYFWDFGDPASGTANTSTMGNTQHVYSSLGTFTASLILVNNCGNDTIKNTITIATAGPTPAVSGNTNICRGDRVVYTATGGSTYTWSINSATTITQVLSPTLNTQYTLTASKNGCNLSKTFLVNVNNCTGLDEQSDSDAGWLLYPNPTQGLLYLNLNEQANETHIKIRVLNSLGALVQAQELELKSNTATLQTNTLPDGIYTLLIDGGNDNTVSKRFVVNR
jgi:hypothetical protein